MRRYFLLFLCLLFTCPITSCREKETSVLSSDIEVVKVPNDKKVFDNLPQVEKNATIIIEGVAEESLGQKVDTNQENKSPRELPDYGFTIWNIKVTKIYKGNVKVGDKLNLLLEYYLTKQGTDKEAIITFTALKPPIIGREYILFLKYDQKQQGYWPVSDYEGMFPEPDSGLKNKVRTNKLQQSDLEIYSDESLQNVVLIYCKIVNKYFH